MRHDLIDRVVNTADDADIEVFRSLPFIDITVIV